MSVEDMRDKLSAREFLYWNIYHARKAQRMELQALKQQG